MPREVFYPAITYGVVTIMRALPLIFLLSIFTLSSCSPFYDENKTSTLHRAGYSPSHRNISIVIDPGHGGYDPGALSKHSKYKEKNLTLTTGLMLKEHLRYLGYNVVMTRKRDTFISLTKRSSLANKRKSTLFVSIHYNAAPNLKANGIEIFYYKPLRGSERSSYSKKLAQAVLSGILLHTKATSRGVKDGSFHVIRATKMPSILVEGGFITNEKEMSKLRSPAYLNRISWGIAQGINSFVEAAIL
jgi:N-acetylmuramoyl-L-alanine amidase